jgi:hypothetical protein
MEERIIPNNLKINGPLNKVDLEYIYIYSKDNIIYLLNSSD